MGKAVSEEDVIEALKSVSWPGFDKDIITLGAVRNVNIAPGSVTVELGAASADGQTLAMLTERVKKAVLEVANGAEVNVTTGDNGAGAGTKPAPDPFERRKLAGVGHVVPVISGKGGVGKSTVSVNLACALSALGSRTGLLDLDIFGPSIHKMLGVDERLTVAGDRIIPVESKGVKVVSIGMALEDDEAMILRGPMLMKIVNQFLNMTDWGDTDYLVVDLPPGTGDIPLSLAQQVAITGAIVVTTPQDIALADVRRAVTMFRKTQTHMLGLVENMSYYVCEKCGDIAHIFGEDGGARESEKLGLPLLGRIPISKSICDQSDKGQPLFNREKSPELADIFEKLANKVKEEIRRAPDPAMVSNGSEAG